MRRALLTFPFLLAAAPVPVPWAPTADNRPAFSTLLAPGVAPSAIHVEALSCPLPVGTPLTARYQWDFGDPRGRFNQLPGFVAGHLYDRPGTYTVTLTVTDEAGHVGVARGTVTIAPDARRAVYVAPTGDDANNGDTEATPLRTAAAAFARLSSGRRGRPDPGHLILLFRTGGTYPVTDTLNVRGPDVVVGQYGPPGPKPTLLLMRAPVPEGRKGPHGFLSIDQACDGVAIEHLTIATPYVVGPTHEAAKVGFQAIVARGHNVVVRGCTFRDVDDAVNANGAPAGLLVQDCDAAGLTDLRGYLVWGQGTDHAYLGNRVGNSTREHVVRMTGLRRVLLYGNDFTNADRSGVDKYDGIKGCIEMHQGQFAYVAGNRSAVGTVRCGPRGGDTEAADTATDWCVIDGNDLVGGSQVHLYPGSHHIMVRNNLIRRDTGAAIEVDGPDGAGRANGDVAVVQNTVVDDGPTGVFLHTWGRVDGLTVANNLFVAPHLRAGVYGSSAVNVGHADLAGVARVSHDLWPVPASFAPEAGDGGVCCVGDAKARHYYTAAAWAGLSPPVDGDRFVAGVTVDDHGRPAAGGPADGAGRALPGGGLADHDGRPRPTTGPVTAGAFQLDR